MCEHSIQISSRDLFRLPVAYPLDKVNISYTEVSTLGLCTGYWARRESNHIKRGWDVQCSTLPTTPRSDLSSFSTRTVALSFPSEVSPVIKRQCQTERTSMYCVES